MAAAIAPIAPEMHGGHEQIADHACAHPFTEHTNHWEPAELEVGFDQPI